MTVKTATNMHGKTTNKHSTLESSESIEFTLSAILETIEVQARHKDEHTDKHRVEQKDEQLSDIMILVLSILEQKNLSRREIFDAIGMKNDFRAFKRNVEPLLVSGLIEMTIPDKPSSKLQKY